MPQNIFKIYDGRTNFWQWDTNQKLIVLDGTVTEVHFSNRDMNHTIVKCVYEQNDMKLCDVPSLLLQLPRNLVAYAYANGTTVKSVKFAVRQRPIPDGYVMDQSDEIGEKLNQIDVRLEALDDSKADNIYYNEEGQYIQLTANGELIGDPVTLPGSEGYRIEDCKIDENGHLVVTLSDGRIIDAGYVGSESGATFTPHISEDKILTWTCDKDLPVPDPVDLNPFDEWTTLPEEGVDTEYEWEFM